MLPKEARKTWQHLEFGLSLQGLGGVSAPITLRCGHQGYYGYDGAWREGCRLMRLYAAKHAHTDFVDDAGLAHTAAQQYAGTANLHSRLLLK